MTFALELGFKLVSPLGGVITSGEMHAVSEKVGVALLPVGTQIVEDLIGFWVMWHLYGGFEGLEEFGMHKSTIWRKVARFRKITGSHPDVYQMPGITIDPKAYWAGAQVKVGRTPKKHT